MRRRSKTRIIIPNGSKERIELLEKIYAQHKKQGKKSPLHKIKLNRTALNWNHIETELKKARQFQDEIDQMHKTISETEQNRDLILLLLLEVIKKSKTTLKKAHASNLKKLQEHGFEVQDNDHRLMS